MPPSRLKPTEKVSIEMRSDQILTVGNKLWSREVKPHRTIIRRFLMKVREHTEEIKTT